MIDVTKSPAKMSENEMRREVEAWRHIANERHEDSGRSTLVAWAVLASIFLAGIGIGMVIG